LAESITPSAEVSFDHTAIMAGGTYNGAKFNEEVASFMTDGFVTADDHAFYVFRPKSRVDRMVVHGSACTWFSPNI